MGDIGEKLRAGVSAEKSTGKVTRKSQLGTEYAEPLDEMPGLTQMHWGESGPRQRVVDHGPSVSSKKPKDGPEDKEGRKEEKGGGGMAGSDKSASRRVVYMSPEALKLWAEQQAAAERARIDAIPQSQPSVRDPRLESRDPPDWMREYMERK